MKSIGSLVSKLTATAALVIASFKMDGGKYESAMCYIGLGIAMILMHIAGSLSEKD